MRLHTVAVRPGPSAWPRPDCAGPAASCPKGTNPGRTHRFYTGKAVVPFGYGLSYTSFKYTLHEASPTVSLQQTAAVRPTAFQPRGVPASGVPA